MGDSVIKGVCVSVLRGALIAAGAWFVRKGWVEDGMWQEAATGLAVIVVTQVWGWWRINRRALIHQWEVRLGLEATPETATEILTAEAKARLRDGWKPWMPLPPNETDARMQDFY
jgi:hypothetical protein